MSRPAKGYRTADGKRVPGVTTIISRFKESGGLLHWAWKQGCEGLDYRQTRDTAAGVGTLGHELCDAWLHDRPEPQPPRDMSAEDWSQAQRAFDGFQRWASSVSLKVVATETPMVSEAHRVGGTPDIVGYCAGEMVVLDIKTGSRIYSDTLLQLGAYAMLWEECRGETIQGAHVLRLGKESGSFTHASYPRDDLELGLEQFLLLRRAYENDKRIKKLVG